MTEFLFAWEQKYKCPKCLSLMEYKPEREKLECGVGVVNHWHCSKCEFKSLGVFDLIKDE